MSSANSDNFTSPICQPKEWEKIFTNDASGKGISLQNLQTVHAAKYHQNKQPNQKMGRRPK